MKNNKIYLFGGGGHAKVVMDVLRSHYGKDCIVGIFDDDLSKINTSFYNTTILGPVESFENKISRLIIAIGNNQIRKDKAVLLQNEIGSYSTGIHSTAIISNTVIIGHGTVIMPGVYINADSKIGEHCILNTNATIEHDCIVEDYVHIAPGTILTGGVKIGEMSFVGANSTVLPGVTVGKNCVVAAGCVVRKPVPDNSLVYGNPSVLIKDKYTNGK